MANDKRQTLHFEVEDKGAGIATEELESLFEPFVQTETGRKAQQGTGLGLSIARKFVQLLGGKLTVRSTRGRGSCFEFDICVARTDEWGVKRQSRPAQIVSLAPNQPRYCILVAEDVQMPVLDGLEVTREIRAMENATGVEARAAIPIIALTASILENERDAIFAAGCKDVLSKPFQELDWIKRLNWAARSGDDVQALQLLEEIPEG